MGPKPRDWPELRGGGCAESRAEEGQEPTLVTKREAGCRGASVGGGGPLCRRKRWNIPGSRTKAVKIHREPVPSLQFRGKPPDTVFESESS